MTIVAGTRLGRYEIRSKIGAGGMGEVYLARDSEPDRTVAIKILPADVASDQQRLQRFIQEAKAASALNHPHISHLCLGSERGQTVIRLLSAFTSERKELFRFGDLKAAAR